jgi:hypothetical protein
MDKVDLAREDRIRKYDSIVSSFKEIYEFPRF